MLKTNILQKFGIFLLLCSILGVCSEASAQRGGRDRGGDRGGDRGSRGGFDPSQFRRGGDMSEEQRERIRAFFQQRFGQSGGRPGGDRGGPPSGFRGFGGSPPSFGGRPGGDDRGRSFGRFGGGDDGRDRGGFDRSRFEEFRRQREEEQRRGGDDSRRDSGSSSSGFTMRPKERFTIDLPSRFAEGDLDTDGQIGFYEWKKWRRDAIGDFYAYDHNNDGFLTPKELELGPQENSQISSLTAIATSTTPSPSTAPATAAATPQPSVSTSNVDMSSTEARRGASAFRLLDRDRNGSIDEKEWERSSRLKPQFEKAGVDISQPLDRESFIVHYVNITDS